MDRASDSGSEGWGFESLLAYQNQGFSLGFLFYAYQEFFAVSLNSWEGTEPVEHATGMFFVALLLAYHLFFSSRNLLTHFYEWHK